MARERSKESFGNFLEELNKEIHILVNSRDSNDRIAAIISIDQLIDLNYDDQRKITRFSNYLRNILTNQHGDAPTVLMVTRALGRLAKASDSTTSKTLTAEWVDFETKRALEWLEGDNTTTHRAHRDDGRRYAAVYVLKELAENAPTLFYAHVQDFLKHIWNGLRDPSHIVRDGSKLALSAVLALISERHSLARTTWYYDIFQKTKDGFKMKNAECIHGSLLVIGELLKNTTEFMSEQFEYTCETVLSYANDSVSRDKLVRNTVIRLIPNLAKVYQQRFIDTYFEKSINIIIGILRSGSQDRLHAFIALGQLALRVGEEPLKPYIDTIMTVIKDGITPKNRKAFVPEALTCLSMIGEAVGESISVYVTNMFDQMFVAGLTKRLTAALSSLAENIPSLLRSIQERLLDTISLILARTPYNPLTSRSSVAIPDVDHSDPETIELALKTLGEFNMRGHNLTEFVKDCVINYLEDDSPEIRKEAAKTCCKLLVSEGKPPVKGHFGYVVGDVLTKLLTVGITDSDPSIRLAVLSSLDYRFDHYLALSDNLRALFIALNDENFEIRECSISIIGRLSVRNPAFVLPSLRKALLQLLTELEFSEDSRNKEESARMLGLLIEAAPRLIKPYVSSILKVLMEKISDPNPTVSSHVLDTTGKLAQVGGTEIMQFMDQLLPLVIETLHDQGSSVKRAIAVRTLGQLVASTGYVIMPYTKYPNLLTILFNILKGEEEWSTRREVIKVLGILGAIDPYKHKVLRLEATATESATSIIESTADILPGISPSSEEYYPTVAFTALIRILNDPSLKSHHTAVIQAVMFIYTSLGMKCVPFLPQVLPPFLNLIRTCDASMRNNMFQQLSVLVSIVKQHIRNYLDEIFNLIQAFWSAVDYKVQIILLEEEICKALNEEFKPYLPEVIPQLLGVLQSDHSNRQEVSTKALHALYVFGRHLEDYLYLVIPAVVRLFEHSDATIELRLDAIKTISRLSRILNFSEYSSRIIHPLTRALKNPNPDLRKRAMDTLCTLVHQLGPDYTIFIPMVNKILSQHHIQHARYKELVNSLLKGNSLPEETYEDDEDESELDGTDESTTSEVKKMHVNQQSLRKAWEASQRATKEDWTEWIRGFSVELLRESPSPALRSCSALAQVYHPLARELFNAGFVSCWTELDDKSQAEVVRALEMAFSSPNLPPEVLQNLLNLAEFMEHDEKPLPIAISALGTLAEKCQCYAKGLHYKEILFQENPSSMIEDLISINNQLQQHEAAMGILKYAQNIHSIELKESWYEKLQRWEEAYDAYEEKQKYDSYDPELTLGRMRCLKAMGQWEKLYNLCKETWTHADQKVKTEMAPMAAAAAWNLSEWDTMKQYVNSMVEESSEGTFFRAILSIHRNEFALAQQLIDKTRHMLDTELAALVGESYIRAYDIVVRVQQLSEMEEIIQFKKTVDKDERKFIRRTWTDRLKGCKRNVDHWQDILLVRQLVVSPQEDLDVWLKFASLCRKSNKMQLSSKTLSKLVNGFDPLQNPELLLSPAANVHPKVSFEYLQHMWAEGRENQALQLLSRFVENVSGTTTTTTSNNNNVLLARCYLTLGQWQKSLSQYKPSNNAQVHQILDNLKLATDYDKDWYKAWHAWAMMNSEVVAYYEQLQHEQKMSPNDSAILTDYLVNAIQGFFRSISLSTGSNSSLQDILRLLTLWFKHGAIKRATDALNEGFSSVSIDTWLEVIPQIIARVNSHVVPIQRLIHKLLSNVGKTHPQALIYPLTVCSFSASKTRKRAAEILLTQMRVHSPVLVEQALLVSHELIRVAILWNELWHEGLEESSRLYFGEHDVEGMFKTLKPLHQMMDKAETLSELSFQQAFGRDLQEALEWCKKYKRSKKDADLTQAWDLYYHVFRRINKQLHHMIKLELQFVSPKLLESNCLELAVPGTYRTGSEIVRIASFARQLKVITSKQRPRKLKIYGSDGNEYQFLLKGHEDLRQDERVMQLFGLVNTLLQSDPETSTRDLTIKRYAVIPLSSNAGLIGWVDNCDTLHALIKEYRESRNVLLNIEHRLMMQMAADYDNLSLMQKIEVFEYALENTTGQDLYKVLWLKSRNSEVWLDRRTNYTRSLAVMSMVGYILGLGDRHPSNLMLEKLTGKVVHIDFGDCFEVAMNREKFPERIPFRLTRMLVNAMEVCGIEGTFKSTCESVMRVLRENKDSVMAMLEAFVHDPLINWRLLEAANDDNDDGTKSGSTLTNKLPKATVMYDQQQMHDHFNQHHHHDGIHQDGMQDVYSASVVDRGNHPSRSVREREIKKNLRTETVDEEMQPEELNKRALSVINRINKKLTGRDFEDEELQGSKDELLSNFNLKQRPLDYSDQVQLLIEQATSHANLCQCYIGWCAWW
jgi:FKBP12-rapamycin complex-associated protein